MTIDVLNDMPVSGDRSISTAPQNDPMNTATDKSPTTRATPTRLWDEFDLSIFVSIAVCTSAPII